MDLTASQISGASFRTARKGYDPDEVDAFLAEAARALEAAQQQATAMEARARAAVARLQEAGSERDAEATGAVAPTTPGGLPVSQDDAETISRTLLLAQRTADTTVSDARVEADRLVAEARAEADRTLDSAREMAADLLSDARAEARRVEEVEREVAANEVEALRARREFLIGDVDQLERFLVDQRDRLRSAARQIEALCERVPSGLGAVRPPALSAADETVEAAGVPSDEPVLDETAELPVPPATGGPFAGIDELADALDGGTADADGPHAGADEALDPPVRPTAD
jgi:DivIVA domain-containing protein